MHNVTVALNMTEVVHNNTARAADTSEVIATKVDEHQMLTIFLLVCQQISFQRIVLLHRGTARACTRDGVGDDLTALDCHE